MACPHGRDRTTGRLSRFRALGARAVMLALMTAGAAEPGPTDWPQFRGPGGLGVSAARGVPIRWGPTQQMAWKAELPGKGASSPIVVGGRVIVTCYRGTLDNVQRQVLCFDQTNGSLLWSTDIPSKLPEGRISRSDHGYASSTPACDGERLYAYFGKSGVFALDLGTGRRLWQAEVGSGLHEWGSAASPVLFGDWVIVNACVESGCLVALDQRTGREVWRAGGLSEAWNTPLLVPVHGRTDLVVAIPQQILGFDPATGQRRWTCATGIGWYMVPSLVAHEGVVFCMGGRSGDVLAVRAGGRGDVTSTHRLWTGKKGGSNVSSPVYHQGHLYWVNDSSGIAYCVQAKTGEFLYSQRLPGAGEVYSAAVLAEGRLYYLDRDGRTYVLAARPEFGLLAINDLEPRGRFNSSPAVADGHLFIRSDRFLYGIGSP